MSLGSQRGAVMSRATLILARDAAAQAFERAQAAHHAQGSGETYRALEAARNARREAQDAVDAEYRKDTGDGLANAIGNSIADGLQCSGCHEVIEAHHPRSVTEDDRVFCDGCYPDQDPTDPYLGPKPYVPVRKVAP